MTYLSQHFSNLGLKRSKRVGRGIAAGGGKTAGRGTKGQKSRTGAGGKLKSWFEGGQTPLYLKLAKVRGNQNPNRRVKPITLTTAVVDRLYKDGETVSVETLISKGFMRANQAKMSVKLVNRGDLTKKVTIADEIKRSKSLT